MLADGFGRRIDYLRLSVIEDCNFRCFYCMPKKRVNQRSGCESLQFEELFRLVRAFAELGVRNVRLTGGEPLLRRDLTELATRVGELDGITDLSLSTNAYLLARVAEPLHRAGVQRVNISLDSLDADNFRRITRGGELSRVLNGIDRALEVGMAPVKLNMVVMRGVNEHEIDDMIDFSRERGLNLRFIETMPVGQEGADAMARHVPAADILTRVRERFGGDLIPVKGRMGAGPARYYQVGGEAMTVGVISAVSRHFCESCNRVRLSARGELLLCLGRRNRVDLAPLVRDGASDQEIRDAISQGIASKPWGHDFADRDGARATRMSAIGG